MLNKIKINDYFSSLKDVLYYLDYMFPIHTSDLKLVRCEPFIYFLLGNGKPYLRIHDIFLEHLEDGRKLFDMSVKGENVELSKLLFENGSLIISRKNFLEFKILSENGNVIKIEKSKEYQCPKIICLLINYIDFQGRIKTSS